MSRQTGSNAALGACREQDSGHMLCFAIRAMVFVCVLAQVKELAREVADLLRSTIKLNVKMNNIR